MAVVDGNLPLGRPLALFGDGGEIERRCEPAAVGSEPDGASRFEVSSPRSQAARAPRRERVARVVRCRMDPPSVVSFADAPWRPCFRIYRNLRSTANKQDKKDYTKNPIYLDK